MCVRVRVRYGNLVAIWFVSAIVNGASGSGSSDGDGAGGAESNTTTATASDAAPELAIIKIVGVRTRLLNFSHHLG